MSIILFSRPNYDDVTGYLYYYSKELVHTAESRGHKVINKEKTEANSKTIISVLRKNTPSFIMFNGHGSMKTICGHNNEVIIDTKNKDLLKNKLTYSVSCDSAETLGRSVGNGDTAFIGYTSAFAIGMDNNSQAAVNRDKWAKLFLEPSNTLVKSLLKGNSAKDAVDKAKIEMRKNISLLKTETSLEAKEFIPYLYNNYSCLEILGNEDKTI